MFQVAVSGILFSAMYSASFLKRYRTFFHNLFVIDIQDLLEITKTWIFYLPKCANPHNFHYKWQSSTYMVLPPPHPRLPTYGNYCLLFVLTESSIGINCINNNTEHMCTGSDTWMWHAYRWEGLFKYPEMVSCLPGWQGWWIHIVVWDGATLPLLDTKLNS